jgi:tetratricopeptide (TPR) repeat protein
LLSAGESEKLKGDLAGANKSLLQERDYRIALAAADKARLEADKVAELTALQSAAAIHPTPELSGQVRDLQVQLSLQRGKEFKASGRLEEAKEVLQEAVKMGKTSAASAELADVDQLIQQRALIEAGDMALGGGKLDEALAKYLEADKLRSDAELNDKIADARYRIHMTKADSLRDAKNYSEAAAAYERARQAKPATAADVDARLAAMKKKEQYDRLLARIRDLRKQEKYSEALRYLKDAKALADTPDVTELMTRTRYDQAVALGREAMAREDYKNAQAYLTMARKYKDTDEVNQLLNDVEARLKASK